MGGDMKYPEEIKQDDMIKNLERLQTELKRRREEGKPVDKTTEDYVKSLDNLINHRGRT